MQGALLGALVREQIAVAETMMASGDGRYKRVQILRAWWQIGFWGDSGSRRRKSQEWLLGFWFVQLDEWQCRSAKQKHLMRVGACGPQSWPHWAWGAFGMPTGRCLGGRWTHGPGVHVEGWSQRYIFWSQGINDNSSCRSAWDPIKRH